MSRLHQINTRRLLRTFIDLVRINSPSFSEGDMGKALGILLKERGCTEARTNNDTANPPILRLNEKLGYHKRPGVMLWERMLYHPGETHD